MRQEENETVDDFIVELYSLTEHCVYGELHDEMIRDRIVMGVHDRKLCENLQLPVKGKFSASLQHWGKTVTEEVYMGQMLSRPLLGTPAIEALGLVQRVNNVQESDSDIDITQLYPKLFQGLGKL